MQTPDLTAPTQQNAVPLTSTPKKSWVEPEITIHKDIKEVTLAIRCAASFPKCISVTALPI